MAASADRSKPYVPLASLAEDSYSKENDATATCFCGAVQLAFPTEAPRLVGTFVCHCTDCHKLTASMFASNFTILNTHLTHVRGQENLTRLAQSKTVPNGNEMANYFCKTCGTLVYRIEDGFPGTSILRIVTVNDFMLMETKLRPAYSEPHPKSTEKVDKLSL